MAIPSPLLPPQAHPPHLTLSKFKFSLEYGMAFVYILPHPVLPYVGGKWFITSMQLIRKLTKGGQAS